MRLVLPYPPSVNNLYYTHGGRRHLSSEGRAYHANVLVAISEQCGRFVRVFPTERVGYVLDVSPPDKRKRDLSNVIKAVEDAITKAGVWEDDSQVDDLHVRRRPPIKGGSVELSIEPIYPTA